MLGTFVHEESAARAYDEAARKHYGAAARTNADMGLYPSMTPNDAHPD